MTATHNDATESADENRPVKVTGKRKKPKWLKRLLKRSGPFAPLILRLYGVFGQLTQFALVGGIGFVVDTGIFNLLYATVLNPQHVTHGSLIAKFISTLVAIFVNWIGNRFWTFRSHRREDSNKEGVEFVLVSLLGMAIGLGCLGFSHYVLGFRSQLADNISGNVIGLVLGSIVRFWLYKKVVYSPKRSGSKARKG